MLRDMTKFAAITLFFANTFQIVIRDNSYTITPVSVTPFVLVMANSLINFHIFCLTGNKAKMYEIRRRRNSSEVLS